MQHRDNRLLESFKCPIPLNMYHQGSSFFSVPPISCILVQHAINFEAPNQHGMDFHQYTLLTLKTGTDAPLNTEVSDKDFPPPGSS